MGVCDGYASGQGFIRRSLFFVSPPVTLEIVVWLAVSVPKMSPGGIDAFINQLTWVSGLVIGAAFIGPPAIVGLAFALGAPTGKDSYCHMATRGLVLGAAICSGVFGVEVAFF